MKNFFTGFKTGFSKFGHHIASIVNFILLFFVYFIGVGLTSLVAKIFRKHFLDLGKKQVNSMWIKKKITKQPYDDYLRRF
tara:strand:- start:2833 stop:3072 length:240 start_codon:yes stop_codon:yes gene_type:complete